MPSVRTVPALALAAAFAAALALGAAGALDPQSALISGALLPAAMWVMYVRGWDYREPEPWSLIALAFVVGMASVLPALLGEALLETGDDLLDASVVAPLVEEASKPLGLYVLWRSVELDDELDAVFYAVTSGMGFAFVENVLYEIAPLSTGYGEWALVSAARGTASMVGHACYTSLTGLGLAAARFGRGWGGFLPPYLLAVALHGAGNALLILSGGDGSPLLLALALLAEPLIELLILRWVFSRVSSPGGG